METLYNLAKDFSKKIDELLGKLKESNLYKKTAEHKTVTIITLVSALAVIICVPVIISCILKNSKDREEKPPKEDREEKTPEEKLRVEVISTDSNSQINDELSNKFDL